jgi:hypothetical protein
LILLLLVLAVVATIPAMVLSWLVGGLLLPVGTVWRVQNYVMSAGGKTGDLFKAED